MAQCLQLLTFQRRGLRNTALSGVAGAMKETKKTIAFSSSTNLVLI